MKYKYIVFTIALIAAVVQQTPTRAAETKPAANPTGLSAFEKDGLYGFRDAAGKTVLAPRYAMVEEFDRYGHAVVFLGGKWLLIDRFGETLAEILPFDNGPDYLVGGLRRFRENGKVGFLDAAGVKVIPARFDFAFPFKGDAATVCQGCRDVTEGEHRRRVGGRWALINRRGRVVGGVWFGAPPVANE